MTRTLDATFITQMNSSAIQLAYFVEIEFNSGTVHFWSGLGDIVLDPPDLESPVSGGTIWTGAGNLIGIQPAREPIAVVSSGLSISLDGVDPAIISLALLDVRQNKPVSCWFGFMNTDGTVVGGDSGPYLFFKGKVDSMHVSPGPEAATIVLQAESELISLNRARIRRFTHQDQLIDYGASGNTDRGFEYVDSVSLWIGDWGSQITEDKLPAEVPTEVDPRADWEATHPWDEEYPGTEEEQEEIRQENEENPGAT